MKKDIQAKPVTLALIGAGGIAHQWAGAIKEMDGMHLRIVVDTDLKKARSIAMHFPGCSVEKDWRRVMKDSAIDAVLIATPHSVLAPISYGALTAGKHVLCEKPAGITAKEIKKNVLVAKKKKLVYMPGFNHRFHPAFMQAREIFEKGGIGKLDFIRARYGFGGRPGYNTEWRFSKAIAGGGELLDQGMHMIDMARWFLGDFTTVHGFAENFFWGGEVEDNGFLLMRTKKGQVASIHVSWTNWDWVHSFEIFGRDGYLRIDGLDTRYKGPERLVWGTRDASFAHPEEKSYVFATETKHDSLRREMESFVQAVQGDAAVRKLLPSGADALAAVQIIEHVYTHGKAKK